MPFAHHPRVISAGPQNFRDRDAPVAQLSLVRRLLIQLLIHRADPRLVRIEPRQKRRSRRTASRHVVELRKANSLLGHRIDMRRMNFTPITPQVRKPHVVGEDNDNIRPRGSRRPG